MSTEIEFRQKMRNKKQKKKLRQNVIIALLCIVILAVTAWFIRLSIADKEDNPNDVEFIFNGYVYPELPPKNTDILVDAANNDGIKTAYLTFDDGPNNSITPLVLDALRRYNIKATFFITGKLIEENPAMARRLYDEGHFIANHSYSHNYNELYADTQSFMNEVNQTEALIKQIVGRNNYPKILRFPGGSYNSGSHAQVKQEIKAVLPEHGYRYCDWNALTGDAETNAQSASRIMSRLKSSSKDKEDIVILMHDSVAKKITAQTLPEVINYLVEQGYTFSTLDKI